MSGGLTTESFILVGPTGAGKTDLAIAWAVRVGGEVLSADSRQIYRHLSIGTGKPRGTWRGQAFVVEGVAHHLMDILEPGEIYSAGRFAVDAESILANRSALHPLMIVGGTGLYLKALVDGLAPLPPRDDAFRGELMNRADQEGRPALHAELRRVDPAAGAKIPPNNIARVIRALEVFHLTGRPISAWQRENTIPSPRRFRWWGLRWDRDALKRRLSERCRRWLSKGMIEETRALLDAGAPARSPCFGGLGYPLVIDFLSGRLSRHELEEQFIHATWQYAKRQMTWFSADPRIRWLNVDERSKPENILQEWPKGPAPFFGNDLTYSGL